MTDSSSTAFSPATVLQAASLSGDHAILLLDLPSRTILACNEAAERVFGYGAGELVGKDTRILHVSDEHYRRFGEESARVLENGSGSYHCHYWLKRRDGSTFASEHLVRLIEDLLVGHMIALSIVRDLTESACSEPLPDSPRPGDTPLHGMTRHLPGMAFQHVRTREGVARNTFLSGSLFKDYDLDMEAMLEDPASFFDALHPDDRSRLDREMARSAEDLSGLNIRVRLRIPSGEFIWLHIVSQPRRLDDDAVVWDGFALDVTREQETEERLHQLATHDPLTGLPNPFQFVALLDRMFRRRGAREQRIAVAQINLGRMVYINETYGFDAGDELLRQAGARLLAQANSQGLVARGHGNTFLVALEASMADVTLTDILRRLQAPFTDPFVIRDDVAVRGDARIGLALYPGDGQTADSLLRASGIALDRAKRHPDRSYEFYAAEQGQDMRRRIRQEQALHDAIDAGLFIPHFQPQVSLADGSLVGLEALARCLDGNPTPLSPAEFIPLAEETGLIVPLGQLILERVLTCIGEWTRAGLRVPPVAVNFSARQFRQGDFESGLRETLSRSGVDPSTLVVELTESSLLQDFSKAEKTMRSLAELGVRFAIDDFGTGFSSLSYLARLPFHTLKIDRSFISAIEQDVRQRAITEALILMSRGLDLRVVAEGVETEDQARRLMGMGCHSAQGFFYARPMPAEEVEDWLRNGSQKRVSA
ncbi:hypothetical protein B1C78_10345 [Thioalkalivibrio denitrificans]|uniref:GGDEF domain-containing protein n=1 Tax=Thioalkalivibrio denitrificans TaxID=108003 RepID=A0A1V3NEY6_9GAMM|nr:EAL domain-containing protein [Thioalkalivibrio denitrificans]OOG23679.1 hypothetical protein B1C78_10345 [Thioalkalivibrio denitrificans]